MQRTAILVALVCLLASCMHAPASGERRMNNIDSQTQNLVALWLQYPDKEEPVLVTEPHAVLLLWRGTERRFYIYDNQTKLTFMTDDFDRFLRQLRLLPAGSEVQLFNSTCGGSLAYEMPDDARERLHATLESRNLKWAVNRVNGMTGELVCTCETTGLRYPEELRSQPTLTESAHIRGSFGRFSS